MDNLWENANNLPIQVGPEITGSFDVGFDEKIPEETKDALMRFIYWVEDHYTLPVTLWVDFKFNHYLMTRDKRRVGYRFYWADFTTWPAFENPDDIPVIELPVRTENRTIKSILESFIQAISLYYIWLSNEDPSSKLPDSALVEAILQQYFDETQ
jgi:hypothetical protein